MYGAWRFDPNAENDGLVQKAVDPATSRPAVQQACQACRTKKLKCSGDKSGCSRCKSLSKPCTYTPRAERGSARRRSTQLGNNSRNPSKQNQTTQAQAQDQQQLQHKNAQQQPQQQPSPSSPESEGVASRSSPRGRDARQQSTIPSSTADSDNMIIVAGSGTGANTASSHAASMDSLIGLDFLMTDAAGPRIGSPFPTFEFAMTDAPALNQLSPMVMDHWLTVFPTELGTWPEPAQALASHSTNTNEPDSALLPTPTSSTAASSIAGSVEPVLAASAPPLQPPQPQPRPPTIINTPTAPLPALVSSSSSSPSPSSSVPGNGNPPCECLQHVAFLVHELETCPPESQGLDTLLAAQKECIDYAKAMLACDSCARRPENLMVLTFLSDRLLQLGETLVERVMAMVDGPSSGAEGGESDGGTNSKTEDIRAGAPSFVFGELELEASGPPRGGGAVAADPAWELLISSLAVLQLRAFGKLLGQLRKGTEALKADAVQRRSVVTETRVRELIKQLVMALQRRCAIEE